MNTLNAALKYAAQKLYVFPLHGIVDGKCTCGKDCTSPGKHPWVPNGLYEATTDKPQIRAWWRETPEANVGIATGTLSGIVVIDVDPEGKQGFLESLGGDLTVLNTTTARTGRGIHLIYRTQEVIRSRTGFPVPGVDIRGEGGYIVAPPSLHVNGTQYEFIIGLEEMAALPPILAERLIERSVEGVQTDSLEDYEGLELLEKIHAVADALLALAPERADSYSSWVAIGMTLYGLGDMGLLLWDHWSMQSDKWEEGVCEEKWRTFDNYNGRRLTLGSLFVWADQDNDRVGQKYEEKARRRYESTLGKHLGAQVPWEKLSRRNRNEYRKKVRMPENSMFWEVDEDE